MAQASGARTIKLPSSVFQPPASAPQPTNSSSRKCWPDQKYIVKLPTPEEMDALRRRREAAGVKIGSVPDLPVQPKTKPVRAVQVSKEDAASLKQSSETKKEGTVLKVPTAEAIEALQRRRAAAKAAASAPKSAASAVRADGLVDFVALAREATARSKAAANLNAPCPLKPVVGSNAPDPDHLNSFLRNKPAADPAVIARRQEEAVKAAKEAELLRQRRAEAAIASQTEGKTVRVPTAAEIEALKKRREAAQNTTVARSVVPAAAKVVQVPLSAEAVALRQRRADAARANGGSGSTVKVPDAAQIEAMRQRRAAAVPKPAATAARPAAVGNLSVHQKLQAKQGAKPVSAAAKRTAAALDSDLRAIRKTKRSRV